MCMTWKATDGRKKKKKKKKEGRKKCFSSKEKRSEGRGRWRKENEKKKLCKKWQELMLMDLYKYYFQHMEKAVLDDVVRNGGRNSS